ncbi:hypothetical protein ACFL31_00065 [Candidatus Margulisiibacteriota bacterium]
MEGGVALHVETGEQYRGLPKPPAEEAEQGAIAAAAQEPDSLLTTDDTGEPTLNLGEDRLVLTAFTQVNVNRTTIMPETIPPRARLTLGIKAKMLATIEDGIRWFERGRCAARKPMDRAAAFVSGIFQELYARLSPNEGEALVRLTEIRHEVKEEMRTETEGKIVSLCYDEALSEIV